MQEKETTNIIINATAAHSSGALSILKNFMDYLYSINQKQTIFYLLTTTKGEFKNTDNVIVKELPIKNWLSRMKWDRGGLQKWCILNNIIPSVVVSFQNTCSRFTGKFRAVRSLVYYHQTLPLIKYPWKCLNKQEYKLFLYAHFYKFFVNRWNKNAKYVVQLPYIKQLFCKKFKNITPERVQVIRPNLPFIDINSIVAKKIAENKKLFIFPATAFEYKNHKIILDAVELLKKEESDIEDKIEIIFTVPSESMIAKKVCDKELNTIIKCIGSVPYEELLSYYKRCDGVLFPSKIESFGLPLVEAALFGVPIIAADLPYAKEVLERYEGVFFVDVDNPHEWKAYIKQLFQTDEKYKPLTQNEQNTWKDFIDLMNSLL